MNHSQQQYQKKNKPARGSNPVPAEPTNIASKNWVADTYPKTTGKKVMKKGGKKK